MSQLYRVSIPVEATLQDGVDVTITHKLEHGLVLDNVLSVKVEDSTTYLDFEIVADQRNEAITLALIRAERFVQLTALVYGKGFEVSMAGIRAMLVKPARPSFEIFEEENPVRVVIREELHVSDHLRIIEHISSLDALLPLWKRMDQRSSVTADGLEWFYLGKITSNERMAFLADWIALELLLERTSSNSPKITILQQHVPKKLRDVLKKEIDQVLQKYIEKEEIRKRLLDYLSQALLQSNIDRWISILQEKGVEIDTKDLKSLQKTRGDIVHAHNSHQTIETSLSRLHKLVMDYLNVLLYTEIS